MSQSRDERAFKIILGRCVTEKSTLVGIDRQYVFRVKNDANKSDIKSAIEFLFRVVVEKVRVCNVKSKVKRFGQVMGKRQGWRKAYVTLKNGQEIKFD